MSIGADVPPRAPAVIGALRLRTELLLRVDSAWASSGEDQARGWHAGRRGTRVAVLLTRVAQRFVDESRERVRVCGTLALGFVRLAGALRGGPGIVGPPDVDEEADQHESDQQELVKQQVQCHDDVPSHRDERRRLY